MRPHSLEYNFSGPNSRHERFRAQLNAQSCGLLQPRKTLLLGATRIDNSVKLGTIRKPDVYG